MRPAPRLDRIPLEAFRVFEAAARLRNFSAAARGLGVTQAAVSRRIAGLEDALGTPLFARRGRRLALTPEGERLGRRVRAALDFLAEGLEELSPAPARITLAAPGSVSHFWLGPRLASFADRHPGTAVRLVTTDAMDELAAPTHDAAILYGDGSHPRWSATPLIAERLAPVAAPGGTSLRDMDLIDYEPLNAHWRTLGDWFDHAGLPRPPRARLSVTTYALAVEAALRGEGAALGSLDLLAGPLAAGRLRVVAGPVWETGLGYHLGLPRDRPPAPGAQALAAALSERVEPTVL